MSTFLQDIRYGFRSLLRRPGFTVAVVLALALGIGANTAIFSLVHGILFKRLPYKDPDRIQMVYMTNAQQRLDSLPLYTGDFLDLRDRSRSFESFAAYTRGYGFTLPASDGAHSITGAAVSAGFFDVLGAAPEMGRTFQHGEDSAQSPPMVVISDRMWRRYLAADPNVIGRTIQFVNGPQTVIGVMPPDFDFPSAGVEIWRNYRLGPVQGRGPENMWGMARLRSAVSRDEAQRELQDFGREFERSNPLTNTGGSFRLTPIEELLFGDVRTPLYIMFGAVTFVLLIAVANVANLMLARSTTREKEVAIRQALGASRGRIARQLLTESVSLALLGGIVGLIVADWSRQFVVTLAPSDIPRLDKVSIDFAVLAFAAIASIVTGLSFGLAPALQTGQTDFNSKLKNGDRGNSASASPRLRAALAISEIALSLILLTGAGLATRSFVRLRSVETGFDSTNVLAVRPGPSGDKYNSDEKVRAFYEELERRVSELSGVKSAGLTNSLPPIENDLNDSFTIEGRPRSDSLNPPVATVMVVTPGYFKALNIGLIRGRLFTPGDRPNAPLVTIINETMARRFFPDEDPIGKRLRIGGADREGLPWFQIVGVVRDVRYDGLTTAIDPAYYLAFAQMPQTGVDLVIKTAAAPRAFGPAIRAQLRKMDPNIPVVRVTTLEERTSLAVGGPRFQTLLLAIFSAVALVLAAIGIYGVLSYSTSMRTHEIGVRMSLGANRNEVLWMVMREGMLLAASGTAAGLAGSLALTRLMSGVLFNTSAHDPATLAAVSALMLLVSFCACFIPARRATLVDPMIALHHD